MFEVSPYAYYDSLAISSNLQSFHGDTTIFEIHLFSYFACLLFLYQGNPVSNWRYIFYRSGSGAPFSTELMTAVDYCIHNGDLNNKDEVIRISPEGERMLGLLNKLSQNQERKVYIEGACESTLSLPVGHVKSALFEEPELRSATITKTNKQLLSESNPSLSLLYEQFTALSKALNFETEDLMVPATVWLRYLTQTRNLSVKS